MNKTNLRIVADEDIFMVKALFSALGEVLTLPAKRIDASAARDADVLLIRSVTKVDEKLLANSQVQFVGTATIGMDHLDTTYLQQRNIAYASAPGCNAWAVVDYVLSVVYTLASRQGFDVMNKSWGIIGCGNVGGRLYRLLESLDIDVCGYDPFINSIDGLSSARANLVDVDSIWAKDIISVHTPLTYSGEFPTYHMIGAEQLSQLRSGALLVNCGRGEVIHHAELLGFLQATPKRHIALDVWQGEPNINIDLLPLLAIATPHIAGYSMQGKARASQMIFDTTARFYGLTSPPADMTGLQRDMTIEVTGATSTALIANAIQQAYRVEQDDRVFRQTMVQAGPQTKQNGLEKATIAENFTMLRKHYRFRPEFNQFAVTVNVADKQLKQFTERVLSALRFRIVK